MTGFDGIAAPLAAALSQRGFTALTPVQTAMLDEGLAGADALVSAQTGSGKTVAFGLALAPGLLDEAGTLGPAGRPLALIIAPTRELALQVKDELGWLYAGAGAVLTSCVGGMDYRAERRALERGAHLVVGTPGRLRDHLERGALDLSELRAVVLDEADEMLDMGFREDLEFILSAAPAERRTLMFSATVAPEVEALAAAFQKDAIRIRTASETRQHGDIEYRAYSTAQRDREHAIINILRFHEARTALVFCKTRAEVNHLMARFVNRGMSVVALSGELTQAERLHALQALRDGRARICIATDVAARGIDLPGLELVIHADLPTNGETLLHRSGRTGRAGRKGVSALIVTPADYRRAHRLLQGAKIAAQWGAPPSAEAVLARDEERLLQSPELTAEAGEDEAAAIAVLTESFPPEALAAAFLRLWRAGRAAPEELSQVAAPQPAAAPAAPRPREAFGPSVWFALSVGHKGHAEARWLLPKLCDAGGITKNEIGAIRVKETETFVQIAEEAVDGFVAALGPEMSIETGLAVTRLSGEPAFDRPAPGGKGPGRRGDGKPARRPGPAPRPEPLQPQPRRPRDSFPREPREREEFTPRPRPGAASGPVPTPVEPQPKRPRYEERPPRPAAEERPRREGEAPRRPFGKPHGKPPHGPRHDAPADGAEAAPRKPRHAKGGGKPAPTPPATGGEPPRRPGPGPGKAAGSKSWKAGPRPNASDPSQSLRPRGKPPAPRRPRG